MEGVCEEYQATCKQLDHSTSPLYTMSTEQLRQLFMSLEQQLLGKASTSVGAIWGPPRYGDPPIPNR